MQPGGGWSHQPTAFARCLGLAGRCSCCWRGHCRGGRVGAMGVRRWLLALLLLLCLALGLASRGPVSEVRDGKELTEGDTVNMVHPKVIRSAGGQRHNAWRRYRRPRPRLSHKGPMPF